VRLLLDTHIWLWSLRASNRLSRRVSRALESTNNELWLSPISVWETLLLAERGRLELDRDPVAWVREQLARVSFREAPLNYDVAIESRAIVLPHGDPADRFLAATALVYDLTLVTADERLLGSKRFSTLANR
jgi:PIN domain nuclease of toxin-antitoxin system